jgi:hypothetical protein
MTETQQIQMFDREAFAASMLEFQLQWAMWMNACYSRELIDNPKEATDRFAEEAIEAMQAMDMSKEDVLRMVDYVFSREKGQPSQEAAGTLSCLATLCNQRNIDLGKAAMADLDYCWKNLHKIREKNALKPKS